MISCTSLAVKLSQRSSNKSPDEKGSPYSSQKIPAVNACGVSARRELEASVRFQCLGPIRFFPAQIEIFASEMAVGSGRLINWT